MTFLKQHYGPAEGPFGFPMPDQQARAVDALVRALPKSADYRYRKAVIDKGPTEISPGERSDVSWITTEDPDRVGDVVLARGMNDSQFQQNPIVTLNHAYWAPPVGKSLWRKFAKDGALKGIKAKTQYPARPGAWPAKNDWPPDIAFALVQAGLLCGKSIGFLPTKVHIPDVKESEKHGWGNNVQLVIDEWLLLEYACTFLPAQQNAVVESVSKALPPEFRQALGIVKGAVPYEETPKADEDRAWDAGEAVGRLKEWAHLDADNPDWKQYQRAFAYVEGRGDKQGDFKLPHHDIIDGALKVVFKGVVAAMAAVNGARSDMDISQEDKARVHHHLARHYQQFGKEPPELKTALFIPYLEVEDFQRAVEAGIARLDIAQIMQDRLEAARGRV